MRRTILKFHSEIIKIMSKLQPSNFVVQVVLGFHAEGTTYVYYKIMYYNYVCM